MSLIVQDSCESLSSAVYNALGLIERVELLDALPTAAGIDAALVDKRLARWKKQRPFDDDALFEQRLTCDGLNAGLFAHVLSRSTDSLHTAFASLSTWPAWVEQLNACLPDTHYPHPVDSNDIDLSQSEGFVDVVRPLIDAARDRLRDALTHLLRAYPDAPFTDPAAIEKMLYADLRESLRRMLTKTMVLEMNVARVQGLLKGETPEHRFWSYVARLRDHDTVRTLIDEYPVLFRRLAARIESWVDVGHELLARLCADWASIVAQFANGKQPGSITKIRSGSGTTRQGGRTVVVFKFRSGFRLLYKPKSMVVDLHFQALLRWANDHGAQPAFRTLGMLDRGDYGWVEWLASETCTSAQAVSHFYQRQGGYLALLYVLQASDFHQDNLIAVGEHPMLIDLEALLQPPFEDAVDEADVLTASQALAQSVWHTDLLPEPVAMDDESDGYDTSGLTGSGDQLTPHTVTSWDGAWTDEMKLVRKQVRTSGGQNLPTLNGQAVDALNYKHDVVHGFEHVYRLLLQHRAELLAAHGPLAAFADDDVRVMLHSNSSYDRLLSDSLHPDLLRDALERDRHFDRLWIAAEQDERYTRVIPSEQRDLRGGDLPLFTTRPGSLHLFDSAGRAIDNFFHQSGLARAQATVSQMSEIDLARQTWLIRASLATLTRGVHQARTAHAPSTLSSRPATVSAKTLLTQAHKVGKHLARRVFATPGDVDWWGLSLVDDRHWSLGTLGDDLYNGLPGVALFLAVLGQVSDDTRLADLARGVATQLRRRVLDDDIDLDTIGAFGGLGGLIYTFAHLGTLWGDGDFISTAQALLAQLPNHIDAHAPVDVLNGSAGCLGGVLALHRAAPSDETLALLNLLGTHVLNGLRPTTSADQAVPSTSAANLRIGFADGLSGLSWALVELAALTGNRDYALAGLATMARERHLQQVKCNESGDSIAGTWRNGAAGIGLVRLRCLRLADAAGIDHASRAAIRGDIAHCLSLTQACGLGANHSLAHGDLGSLEFLAQAAAALDDTQLTAQVNQRVAQMLDSIRADGWVTAAPTGLETPGLMTGLAGIGWGLLRLSAPELVPCVLTLDAPSRLG